MKPELWDEHCRLAEIIALASSPYKKCVIQKGQITPLEELQFMDLYIDEEVVPKLGGQFFIVVDQTRIPIDVWHVTPSVKGWCARITQRA